jgi:nucleotide-binding universal stress UspA family protein
MRSHKRILVALSSPEGRDAAFERALAIARTSGAELYLLHAVPANQPFSFRAAERLQRSTELLQRAEDAGVTAQTVEQHGDPADIIALHADARAVDLIVMGTERRTGWARLRQPSVSERVLRRTTRPTLVVPAFIQEGGHHVRSFTHHRPRRRSRGDRTHAAVRRDDGRDAWR